MKRILTLLKVKVANHREGLTIYYHLESEPIREVLACSRSLLLEEEPPV